MRKGVPSPRKYLVHKPGLSKIEKGQYRKIRNHANLSPEEKIVYKILLEYGMAQMQAVGRGYTMDESVYAKQIIEALNEK